jgi:hypothetical protein
METVAIAAGFVALAVALFVTSIRLGILVGRRLDGSLEARAEAGNEETDKTSLAPVSADQHGIQAGVAGEEYCGE